MSCEQILELLPDHVLGTLSETEAGAVRRHLRGCTACRADAAALDRGVTMFGSAAHDVEPPPELRDRVLTVLKDEWSETPAPASPRRVPVTRWLAAAAVVAALAGSLAWGAVERSNANGSRAALATLAEDARSYRQFLSALGGKEVRVGSFDGTGSRPLHATAVLYDSDRGQSWALVTVRALGSTGPLRVDLLSTTGRRISLPAPIRLDPEGDGAAWLVTSADISTFQTVQLVAPGGRVVATGTTR